MASRAITTFAVCPLRSISSSHNAKHPNVPRGHPFQKRCPRPGHRHMDQSCPHPTIGHRRRCNHQSRALSESQKSSARFSCHLRYPSYPPNDLCERAQKARSRLPRAIPFPPSRIVFFPLGVSPRIHHLYPHSRSEKTSLFDHPEPKGPPTTAHA